MAGDAISRILGEAGEQAYSKNRQEFIQQARNKMAIFLQKANKAIYDQEIENAMDQSIFNQAKQIFNAFSNTTNSLRRQSQNLGDQADINEKLQKLQDLAATGYYIIMEISDYIRKEEVQYGIYKEDGQQLKVGILQLRDFVNTISLQGSNNLGITVPKNIIWNTSVLSQLYFAGREESRSNAERIKESYITALKEIKDADTLIDYIDSNGYQGKNKNRLRKFINDKKESMDFDSLKQIVQSRMIISAGSSGVNAGRAVEKSAAEINNTTFIGNENTVFWQGPDFTLTEVNSTGRSKKLNLQAKNITNGATVNLLTIIKGIKELMNILDLDSADKIKNALENKASGAEKKIIEDLRKMFK